MIIATSEVIICSIFVLWLGYWILLRSPMLLKYQIPPAVIGGIVFSIIFNCVVYFTEWKIKFDFSSREVLLLVFFSSVGLTAALSELKQGGVLLIKLAIATAVFLFFQNLVGVLVASLLGEDIWFGLIGGSVSLAGGHGTAISWGNFFDDQGNSGAMELGIAFATIGLISGGLLGGPLGHFLVKHGGRIHQKRFDQNELVQSHNNPSSDLTTTSTRGAINAILFFAICVSAGKLLNAHISSKGIILPGFVTAMLVGVLVNNIGQLKMWHIEHPSVKLIGQVALNLFLAMSLMSMDLLGLSELIGKISLIMFAQIILVVFFTVFVVYPLSGRNYDAAVISSGFAGIALGATPIGVANMQSMEGRYGLSKTAFIVIPLLGACILDLVNATVIQIWLSWA